MSGKALKGEAFQLSPEARPYLAQELLAISDAVRLAKTEKLWIDEAIRNDEARDARAARVFPADGVLSRAGLAELSRLVSIRYS